MNIMNTRKKLTTALLLIMVFGFTFLVSGCNQESLEAPQTDLKDSNLVLIGNDTLDCSCIINPSAEISEADRESLLFMREEEKLARDVYMTFFQQYNLRVFDRISQSEQRHMDRILCLLNHYQINDPVINGVGAFSNPEIQELYNVLISQGTQSLVAALNVGATIEDVDIFDLTEALQQTDNEAIIFVLNNLRCGSTNHMRAFTRQLTSNNANYTPQYISATDYTAILDGEYGDCSNGNGQGKGSGNGVGNCTGSSKGNGKGMGFGNRNANCKSSGNGLGYGNGSGNCTGSGNGNGQGNRKGTGRGYGNLNGN